MLNADSLGTDFWLAFQRNYDNSAVTLSLFVTGPTSTTGRVDIPGISFSQDFSVTPGTITPITIPTAALVNTNDGVTNLGIHVTAAEEVTVYGLNRKQATTDAFLGLPVDILGDEYIVMSYPTVSSSANNTSQFAVVAVEDGTTLTVVPSATTGSRTIGVPYTVAMNRGQVYQLANQIAGRDLTGSIVTSNKPIAVFGGHRGAGVPVGTSYVDALVEQLPPTVTWGRDFVTMPLATRTRGDTFRILAADDGTQISINNVVAATLNRGQFFERILTEPSKISATKPVLVAQYSHGTQYDGVVSDPFMSLVPPVEQLLASYTVSTPATGFSKNFINLVAPSDSVGQILVDGVPVPASSFVPVSDSGFVGAQVAISLGTHTVQSPSPVGVTVYGFDRDDSYGYPGGTSLVPIGTIASMVVNQDERRDYIGISQSVSAIVLDDIGNPVLGARVDFVVEGANPRTGFAFTRFNGEAIFTYTGATPGTDVVTASVVGLSGQTSVNWLDLPDLRLGDVTLPSSGEWGESINLAFDVSNAGLGPAIRGWSDEIYLSTDQTLDAADIKLASQPSLGQLNSGQSYRVSASATVPNSVSAGEYFLLIKTDSTDSQVESDNGNNVLASPFTITAPNLLVDSLAVSPAPVFGSSVAVSWTVRNAGTRTTRETTADALYLSRDGTLDATDLLLDTKPANGGAPLMAGASYSSSSLISLPLDLAYEAGDYFFIVVTDSQSVERESNENDNVRVSPATRVELPPLPNLIVSSITAPASALSNGAIPISWEIHNNGTAPVSGVFQDRVYLSGDATVGGDTAYGTFEFQGTILPGQTIARTQNITLPPAIEGNYYVVVTTDVSNQIFEQFGQETNNTAIDDQFIDINLAPFPNLIINEVIAPATANSGQQAVVEWIVTNRGNGPTNAPSWYDNVYLSIDQTLDGFDLFLGSVANPSFLDVNDNYRNSLTFTLPEGIDDNYYFIVVTDAGHQVLELGAENDNTTAGGPTDVILTPPPDLQVSQTQAPSGAFSGQTINVNWTVTNQGLGATRQSSWFDRVYMSSNATIDAGDQLLATVTHNGALNPNESYDASATLTLPIGVSGPFYFLVQTDAGNHVFEHVFENNNVGFDATPTRVNLTPPPDLELELVDAPLTAIASRSLTVAYRVGNNGSTATPNSSWQDRLYLSADTTLDASDRLLQSKNRFGVLETGETYSDSFTVTLPDDAIGTFYAIVATDAGDIVFELDNDNNVSFDATPLVIWSLPADLVVAALSGPSNVEAGNSILVDWTVSNNGVGDTVVGTWFDRLYLSADNSISSDDVILATVRHDGILDPSQAYSVSNQFATIPYEVAPGNYFLLVVTDYDDRVYEGASDGNNSSIAVPLAISRDESDLQVTAVSASATALSGGQLTVDWTVRNASAVATNATYWYDDVYLSADNVIDASDVQLGRVQRSNVLDANASYTASRQFALPRDLTGQFFVILRTDSTNRVIEGPFESNNDRATQGSGGSGEPGDGDVDIDLSLVPDLAIVSVDAPTAATSGQPIQISWAVRNDGAAAATGSWFDAVYLSLDQVFDRNNDTYLGFANRPTDLAPGASYNQSAAFNIPAGLAGTYWVFVAADSSDRVFERGAELNNSGYDPTAVLVSLLPPADFVVGTITVPANGVSGQQATITYTVENQGQNAARGTWVDSVYLSADGRWDINDALVGRVTSTNAEVLGGSSYTRTLTAPLPGVVPGDYRVIIRSDILNRIPEIDERNNIGVSLNEASIDFAELVLGTPVTGTLGQGQSAYYKVIVPAGETLSVKLDSLAASGFNEVYVAYNRIPTRSDFDFASIEPFEVDQRAIVQSTQLGTYYVLIYGNNLPFGPQQYEIAAELLEFDVFDSNYGRGGNVGNLTIEIHGAKLDTSVSVHLLSDDGTVILASNYYVASSTRIYATFDLRNAAVGAYDVYVSKPTEPARIVSDGLAVVSVASLPKAEVRLDAPQTVRRGSLYTFSVEWGNASLNDLSSPLLSISSNNPFSLSANELDATSRYTFLGVNTDGGPPGIIRPGHSEVIRFFGLSDLQPGDYVVAVENIYEDSTGEIDWTLYREVLAPSNDRRLFEEAFALMTSETGTAVNDFLEMISRNVTLLAKADIPNSELLTAALRLELQFSEAKLTTSIVGTLSSSDSTIALVGKRVLARNLDNGEVYSAESLSNGQFVISSLSPGRYQLIVPSHSLSNDVLLSVAEGQRITNVSVPVSRSTQAEGYLFSPEGEPIENALVVAYRESTIIGAVTSNPAGQFRFQGLDVGEYSVMIVADNFARVWGTITASGELSADANFTLQRESSILGTIVEDGVASTATLVIKATLRAPHFASTFATSVGSGQFRLDGLPAGIYDVEVFDEFGLRSSLSGVALVAGQSLELASIDISSPEVATVDEGGAPVLAAAASSGTLPLFDQWVLWKAIVEGMLLVEAAPRESWLLWRLYFDSNGPVGTQSIGPGGLLAQRFHDHPTSKARIQEAFSEAIKAIAMRPEWAKRFSCEDAQSRTYGINNLGIASDVLEAVANEDPRWEYGGNFGVGVDGLVGGVGYSGEPGARTPESRFINGTIEVSMSADDVATHVQAQLTLTIQDAIDFWPEANLISYGPISLLGGLALLEATRWTWEVPLVINIDFDFDEEGFKISREDGCECKGPESAVALQCIMRPAAVDPNDILGPNGFGGERWVSAGQPLNYTIRFENDPIFATAPAQVVRITQQLNSDLDFRTFRIGDFVIGGTLVEVPDNRAFYSGRVDLTEEFGIVVDVLAGVDVNTGEAFWEFTSIDPATGEIPQDALTGFLPPNLTSPEGEGFVTYSVRPKTTIATGTVIDAEARIIFDVNEPIDTPPIFNTIDADIPVSSVLVLSPMAAGPVFDVSWSGTDDEGGSGLASFTIYVAENGGIFQAWLTNTTLTSAQFVGQAGNRYEFYSVARDNAGNVEAAPATSDAVTVTPGPAPQVTGAIVQAGMTQRSFVDGFVIDFSGEVNLADLIANGSITSAVTVTNLGVNADSDPDEQISLTPGQFDYEFDRVLGVSRLVWSLDAFAGGHSSLPNGFYQVTLNASLIADFIQQGLDGNADGIGGDNYSFTFHRLLGDANGDRSVNAMDMQLVNSSLGRRPGVVAWNANADLDRDGIVTTRDRLIVSRASGNEIVPPTFGSTIPGDYNNDGSVDSDDLGVWRVQYGAAGTIPLSGDGDGNGFVDGNDFLIWQRNLGRTSPPVESRTTTLTETASMQASAPAIAADGAAPKPLGMRFHGAAKAAAVRVESMDGALAQDDFSLRVGAVTHNLPFLTLEMFGQQSVSRRLDDAAVRPSVDASRVLDENERFPRPALSQRAAEANAKQHGFEYDLALADLFDLNDHEPDDRDTEFMQTGFSATNLSRLMQ